MPTTGEKLKSELGLDNLYNVRIARALISSYKILFVWYDTNRPNAAITTHYIRQFPWASRIWHGTDLMTGKERPALFAPLVDIEKFNGAVKGSLVVTVDLAGHQLAKKGVYTKTFGEAINVHYFPDLFHKLEEDVTIADLRDTGNISDLTMKFRRERNSIMGAENTTAKLVDLMVNKDANNVVFAFLTEATDKYPDDYVYKQADPDANFNLKRNTSETYEIYIKILDFFDWLDAQKGEDDTEITPKLMKEILEVANVQVWSNSPSFHWQGFNFWLSQLDGAMFPTKIRPQFWDKKHGDGDAFVDKHLYGLLRSLPFFLNPMSSMLTKRLRDKGLL